VIAAHGVAQQRHAMGGDPAGQRSYKTMTRIYVRPTTRAQREAVWSKFLRDYPSHNFAGLDYVGLNLRRRRADYRKFRKGFANYGDYIGGQWKGMFIGIEKDGYCHS
jgi:hypothetical protein